MNNEFNDLIKRHVIIAVSKYKDPVLDTLGFLANFTNVSTKSQEMWRGRYKMEVQDIGFQTLLFSVNKCNALTRPFNNWKLFKGKLVSVGYTANACYHLVHSANNFRIIVDRDNGFLKEEE